MNYPAIDGSFEKIHYRSVEILHNGVTITAIQAITANHGSNTAKYYDLGGNIIYPDAGSEISYPEWISVEEAEYQSICLKYFPSRQLPPKLPSIDELQAQASVVVPEVREA
jgi:hypothetical protein